jgi:hypothetical protein
MAGITLLRLYPAAWRERYGDEFTDLIAARPPSLRDRFDILRGAIDARLHPQVGRGAAPETQPRRDRSLGALIVLAGALLSVWAALGVTQGVRWDSGELPANPELLNISWLAGLFGSMLLGAALLGVALRYDWSIGPSGAVGGVLTGAGLVFASMGGGVLALALLGGGTLLLAWRVRGRILGTTSSVFLAAVTSLLIAAFAIFASGDGQELGWLSVTLLYGPAWVLVGLDLHAPLARIQPVGA